MSAMIGRLLARLLNATSGNGSKSGSESQFAGSVLDWSVNYGHGPDGGRQEAAREIAQIQEKAEMLDEQEHHRR